jgi:acetylornithine deacetylase/succinyl-diaminopimelate desuccinylase-like protein
MAANGIVRESLGDLDARLGHWRQTLVDLCRVPVQPDHRGGPRAALAPHRPWHGRARGRPPHRDEANHQAPFGVKVTAKINGTTPWWTTDPDGPAFEAARGALRAGFGKETVMVGAGGTTGFVQPFADLLTGAPCILMGVADPNTQAHSENESLHLGDWVKAMRSTIHLYDALARLPRR